MQNNKDNLLSCSDIYHAIPVGNPVAFADFDRSYVSGCEHYSQKISDAEISDVIFRAIHFWTLFTSSDKFITKFSDFLRIIFGHFV